MARPIPVFPDVASITVCPDLSSPDFSAASMTPRASRSLTDPSGLNASILTNRLMPFGAILLIRTTGVRPTVSRMFANLAIDHSVRAVCHSHIQDAAVGVENGFLHHLRQSRMREDSVHQLFFRRFEIHGD